jgi:hypothetical protein
MPDAQNLNPARGPRLPWIIAIMVVVIAVAACAVALSASHLLYPPSGQLPTTSAAAVPPELPTTSVAMVPPGGPQTPRQLLVGYLGTFSSLKAYQMNYSLYVGLPSGFLRAFGSAGLPVDIYVAGNSSKVLVPADPSRGVFSSSLGIICAYQAISNSRVCVPGGFITFGGVVIGNFTNFTMAANNRAMALKNGSIAYLGVNTVAGRACNDFELRLTRVDVSILLGDLIVNDSSLGTGDTAPWPVPNGTDYLIECLDAQYGYPALTSIISQNYSSLQGRYINTTLLTIAATSFSTATPNASVFRS